MTMKNNRDLERRVDVFCATCEKIALRALVCACFLYEIGRFVASLSSR